jgi:putative membrane protein
MSCLRFSLFAFLHHLAAFALVSALVVELVLTRDDITLKTARKLLTTDMIFGVSAGVILIVGLLRVFYFEKGSTYYFSSIPFIAKISLFIAVGLLSIIPTVEFLSWRKPVRLGRVPIVSDDRMKRVRIVIHAELVGVSLLILCAALMAKGVGVGG